MQRLGLTKDDIEKVFGVRSLLQLIRLNPTWIMYGITGLLFEARETIELSAQGASRINTLQNVQCSKNGGKVAV